VTGFPAHLVREDLQQFGGYSSARTSFAGPPARIWLNANEAAEPNHADPRGSTRRYPPAQPERLREVFAGYLGTDPSRLLLARGSDEAIDGLVRTLCPPGGEAGIVVCPPTFGMYAVSAVLHGVPVHEAPQVDAGHRFEHDLTAVADTVRRTGARVVFLASPGNPTGAAIDRAELDGLLQAVAGTAVVVLDEAYIEFDDARGSRVADVQHHPHLAVLRTMSKAHGLAGARIGALVAHPELVDVVRRVQAPYPLPAPATELALAALEPEALQHTEARVRQTVRGRDALAEALGRQDGVRAVYDSAANFVLVRCADADDLLSRLGAAGIAVRDMRHLPGLADAVRVSVGTPEEVDAVARALARAPERATPMREDRAR
jgi:histidinol-phosphate aminotransferase